MPKKNKINRRRNRAVTIRMNDEEYKTLQAKVKESGLSQQSYIISSATGATIMPSEEIAIHKENSIRLSDLIRQLRGLSTNVNQMAHVANGQGILPTTQELINISSEISRFKKESEEIWLSIRSSIGRPTHTEQ